MSAMVQAPSARQSVQPRPLTIQSRYRPAPSGVCSNSKDIGAASTRAHLKNHVTQRGHSERASDQRFRMLFVIIFHWPFALSLGVLISSLSFSDCGKFKLMFLGGIELSNHLV